MNLYKFLRDGASPFAGYKYPIGEWLPPVEGDLEICRNGYHACREQDLLEWLNAELYVCDWRGDVLQSDTKVAVREIRLVRRVESWNEMNQRLFACDCAERVLHIYEKEHPNDSRVRQCIEIARQYAIGKASHKDLDAARDAAWAAATAAASEAAWAAARAAARAAAWDASRAAASEAAWAAAWAAAWDASSGAARDAAIEAAWAAAWPAEREWQHTRLLQYIGDEL